MCWHELLAPYDHLLFNGILHALGSYSIECDLCEKLIYFSMIVPFRDVYCRLISIQLHLN